MLTGLVSVALYFRRRYFGEPTGDTVGLAAAAAEAGACDPVQRIAGRESDRENT